MRKHLDLLVAMTIALAIAVPAGLLIAYLLRLSVWPAMQGWISSAIIGAISAPLTDHVRGRLERRRKARQDQMPSP